MIAYFLVFSALVASSIYRLGIFNPQLGRRNERFPFGFMIFFIFFIGLRYEVGGDWFSYAYMIEDVRNESLSDAIFLKDPGYAFFNWLSAQFFDSVYFVNFVCAAIFSWGLVRFAYKIGDASLVILIAFPYLIIVVGMGYTRQAAAVGFIMLAIVEILDRRLVAFIAYVILASLFHKSAFIILMYGIVSNSRNKTFGFIAICAAFAGLYYLLVVDSVETFTTNYIDAGYESLGAGVRVAMYVVPAALYLIFNKYINVQNKNEKKFWKAYALGAIMLPIALQLSPSSTAVDRMALYWYPLQLMILASLPKCFYNWRYRFVTTAGLILYSASIMIVWMFWSPNAINWQPYRFLPFEFL